MIHILFIDILNIYKMPNWCDNSLTIEGTAEDLQHIVNYRFNFHEIDPCPFMHNGVSQDGWYEWCIKYWGSKWSAREIEIDYVADDTHFTAHFETPWSPPDAILTLLTKRYASVMIVNEWYDETYETVGINVYSHGSVLCKYIEPRNYTNEALNLFEESNPWFQNLPHLMDEESEEDDNKEEDLKSIVELNEYTRTYEELTA